VRPGETSYRAEDVVNYLRGGQKIAVAGEMADAATSDVA